MVVECVLGPTTLPDESIEHFISKYAKLNLATTVEDKLKMPSRWDIIHRKEAAESQSAKLEANTPQHALPGEAIHLCED